MISHIKTLGIVFIIFCINSSIYSQDFGQVGTKWQYTWENSGSILHIKFESVKDTSINGKTTHKIVRDFIGSKSVYVYQKLDTVFQYSELHNKFFSYLIFNKNKGDTLFLEKESSVGIFQYRMVVDTVFNVSIDGITLKKYKVTALDAYKYSLLTQSGYIIDRIGSLDYFFTQNIFAVGSKYGPLRCYEDSIIDTNFTLLPCDYRNVLSVSEFKNSNEATIKTYPNPTCDFLTFEFNEFTNINNIEIYSVDGNLVKLISNIGNVKTHTLSTKDLISGIYLVKIKSNNNNQTLKFIKK
jgi:hypothetical protein